MAFISSFNNNRHLRNLPSNKSICPFLLFWKNKNNQNNRKYWQS